MNSRQEIATVFGMGLMIGATIVMLFGWMLLFGGRYMTYEQLVQFGCGEFDSQTGQFVIESPAAWTDK